MSINYQAEIESHWPKSSYPKLSDSARATYRQKIKKLLKQNDAVLIAHYYVDAELQSLAEETGGLVADSLEMAKFGAQHPAKTLVVCGVHFMGETAKILSPEKRVFMPTLAATCSLDLSCPVEPFQKFCQRHADRTVVVYANTSAAVKACADWVVTSSIALKIVQHLDNQGEKILWAPDKYLGHWIEQQTGADMLHWHGACIVHEEFKANALHALKQQHPDAAILVHPESPADVIAAADAVGSTSQLLKASQDLENNTFIVATDRGIFYKMQQASPNKTFIAAPTGGQGATCRCCAHCPWMEMNQLQNLTEALETGSNTVEIDETIRQKALTALERMVNFKLD